MVYVHINGPLTFPFLKFLNIITKVIIFNFMLEKSLLSKRLYTTGDINPKHLLLFNRLTKHFRHLLTQVSLNASGSSGISDNTFALKWLDDVTDSVYNGYLLNNHILQVYNKKLYICINLFHARTDDKYYENTYSI